MPAARRLQQPPCYLEEASDVPKPREYYMNTPVSSVHRVYVASSWRNERQPEVVEYIRREGHEVYDFRHPEPDDGGFHWSEIDPAWKSWHPEGFRDALYDPLVSDHFEKDFRAMKWATAFVLVMPCGRSAHLETGWAVGAGKPVVILLSDGEPELMYKMVSSVVTSLDSVGRFLGSAEVPS